ncbi:NAD-dependent epimerase/dehydratase family protein [Sediminicoccus sp. KRV36]|uniref:NAD-dependent epimerase/dehydratase family protein n=1 Tax=Sediminicoccus sp. KRV36 TaxID=3133721 RepID=UPI00200F3FC3|nr:NAD-dependent epimerase/dehydratase family protein [Sediminicoccus rosea]UPY34938.1 NAD-dependent epimerase/dehydratase family protein [Sediminicoccus rosea]
MDTPWPRTIPDEATLEEVLSRPDPALVSDLAAVPGDILVLGAAGKMGPTLCRLARRADPARRVIAVARWTEPGLRERMESWGIECRTADLSDDAALAALPDAPNVIFMAARKFGSTGNEALTWAMNVLLPARVAARWAASRIVFFSTGNVLPLVPLASGGADEGVPPAPVGEYAASCLGRERVFQHAAATRGTPCFGIRLNYAIDLRYGVLHDLALKLASGTPIPLAMGHANVIWQGDANAWILRALRHADATCPVLNVTGPETLSIRWAATQLATRMDVEPHFVGEEAPNALLSNAARAFGVFGYPRVPVALLLDWVADWVRDGGRSLGRATKFEVRDGRF